MMGVLPNAIIKLDMQFSCTKKIHRIDNKQIKSSNYKLPKSKIEKNETKRRTYSKRGPVYVEGSAAESES